VIDAAGNIYLMGGTNGTNVYNDVWVSADKGANRAQGLGTQGGTWGYST
jgi:hypothetical protein